MSRVVKFKQLDSSDVLFIEQRPIPSPQLDEVVLEVKAIGMNRADIMLRTGNYLEKATFPSQLGFEAAGTVYELMNETHRYGYAVSVLNTFFIQYCSL
ncbi:alcohol dehydrogenase catalytic domain-containing protein [Alteromonas sp. NFXS44]